MMAVVATAPTADVISSLRLRVGELVTLTQAYEAHGGSSVLMPGDVGVVVEYDDDDETYPFR